MNCKHNKILSNGTLLYCTHCGKIISEEDDKTCEKQTTTKQTVNITMVADAQERNQMEENTPIACLKYVLDLNQEGEKNMPQPKCKMSINEAEIGKTGHAMYKMYICALATLVRCEGLREDSNNCPYWKRVSE